MSWQARIVVAMAVVGATPVQSAVWQPVSDAETSLRAGRVDPKADVEALSWEVWVSNRGSGSQFPHTVLTNVVRLKFFSPRGITDFGRIVLPYGPQTSISLISARTVKPDGSVIGLQPSNISTRGITTADGLDLQAQSFELPSLRAGDIADYQWQEERFGELADHIRLPVQLQVPAEQVRYHIRPLRTFQFDYPLQLLSFHCSVKALEQEADGHSVFTMTNVPAFHEEPLMPPGDQVKHWVLLYYGAGKPYSGDDYWSTVGRNFYAAYRERMSVDARVRRVADSVTRGANTPEEKLAALADYCRKNIKQVYGEQAVSDDRLNVRRGSNASVTLAYGKGTSFEVNLAFAALATAAGFDARLARVSDRSDIFFDKTLLTPYFLNYHQVAVKLYRKWLFYDPADRRLPSGMLRWQEEGVEALVTDPETPVFVRTPVTVAERSKIVRTAQLTLHPDGTLEGFVREVFNGQTGLDQRNAFASDAVADREHELRKGLQVRFPAAQVAGAKLSLPKNVAEGARFSYWIKVPGYATVDGKRMRLAPAFFQAGLSPPFVNEKRESDVYFHYPWSEFDSVRIKLPDGYQFDRTNDAPGEVRFDPSGAYRVRLYVSRDNELICEREFSFGEDGTLVFQPKDYPALKKIFDAVGARDDERVTLSPVSPQLTAASN